MSPSPLHLLLLLLLSHPMTMSGGSEAVDDVDSSMEMVRAELDALRREHRKMYRQADNNRNGRVTPEEFAESELMKDAGLREMDVMLAFDDLDKDNSDDLTLAEWLSPFEETAQEVIDDGYKESNQKANSARRPPSADQKHFEFVQYDLDNDSRLDERELDVVASTLNQEQGQHAGSPLTGAGLLYHYDQNLDGWVSFNEFLAHGRHHVDGRGGVYEDVSPPELHGPQLDEFSGGGGDEICKGELAQIVGGPAQIVGGPGGTGGSQRGGAAGGAGSDDVWAMGEDIPLLGKSI